MSVIIPYEEKLKTGSGAFIDPNGKILFTNGEHLAFATRYCYGCSQESLINYNDEELNQYLDNFSCLNKKQLELLKIFLKDYQYSRTSIDICDFLVFVLQFDKVETIVRECITTTSKEPHLRFYNYYLMDWRIDARPPIIYNQEAKKFEEDLLYSYIQSSKDLEAEEEIKKIKSKTLIKDRPLFFK